MTTQTFKRSQASLTTAGALTSIYTVPGATTSIVQGIIVSNTSAAAITASVIVSAGGATSYYLAYQAPIPAGSSLSLDKINLLATDVLKAQVHTAASTADFLASYMEIA